MDIPIDIMHSTVILIHYHPEVSPGQVWKSIQVRSESWSESRSRLGLEFIPGQVWKPVQFRSGRCSRLGPEVGPGWVWNSVQVRSDSQSVNLSRLGSKVCSRQVPVVCTNFWGCFHCQLSQITQKLMGRRQVHIFDSKRKYNNFFAETVVVLVNILYVLITPSVMYSIYYIQYIFSQQSMTFISIFGSFYEDNLSCLLVSSSQLAGLLFGACRDLREFSVNSLTRRFIYTFSLSLS